MARTPGIPSGGGPEEGPAGPSGPGGASADGGDYTPFQWLLAWAILLVTLVFLARTRIGYLLLYYALALMIVFLIVTNYQWFAGVLAPFRSLRPGLVTPNEGAPAPALGAVPGAATLP